MTIVIERRRTDIIPELAVTPLLQRIYAHRSVNSEQELETRLSALPSPKLLKDIDRASELLANALCQQQRILIVADFDADGATSCALASRALRAMGAKDVRYVVPNRFEYGYGLTPEIVEVAARHEPDLLITVDNGISSIAGVAVAKAAGIRVLITDHHLPGETLPAADAIVNPNQHGDEFPSKNLAGVGVIFYVMLALRTRLRELNWFNEQGIAEPNMGQFLDLVAFGTIADVVVLDHTNRILVEQGLRRIRNKQCVPGISALLDIAKRQQEDLVANDIAFALGPRLNAAGRLQDMSYGIRCLLCDDFAQARTMARELDRLNYERRDIEAEMQSQAQTDLAKLQLNEQDLPFGLCLYDETWHQGVIGILAARMREQTHRPVIAFAPEQEGLIKGSARSVNGLHIRDVLDAIATANPGLLEKFGGHAMAAGLSLPLVHLDEFSQLFDREVQRHLSQDDLRGVLFSDGELSVAELTLASAEQLRTAGPWGQGFPEPLFDGVFELISHRILAEKHVKMVLRVPGEESYIDAIAFNQATHLSQSLNTQLHVAYKLDVNIWQGRRSAQLIVEYFQPCSDDLS